MKKIFILFAVGAMMSAYLYAQTPGQEYTNRMNRIFQYVNKNRITTGLLSDYGLQVMDPSILTACLSTTTMWIWVRGGCCIRACSRRKSITI